MGHIVNPISFRLGLNRTWNSSWSSFKSINYAYLVQRDLFIYTFLKLFFSNAELITRGFLYSHTKIISVPNEKFKIINYIYNQLIFNNFKKLAPILNIIVMRLIKQIYGVNDLLINNYTQVKNLQNYTLVSFIVAKFYKFLIFSYYKIFYLKPLTYTLKLLNFIITRWLLMISRKFNNYEFSYVFLNAQQVTPQIVSLYIAIKLKQRNMLLKLLKPLFNNLKENNLLLGYKISCSGRFTRKQRATYYWVKDGLIPFNRINAVVDYSYRQMTLPFGSCGIKVWLCRKI